MPDPQLRVKIVADASSARGAITDFNQALEAMGKAVRTVKQIYEATVGEFLEYADVVGDLASITGESAESTSKFITVLGDFGVEMGQITAMGRAMRDEGLTPTLDTLAQLSDRYLALTPGMERTNFLFETLGRNGTQFTDVLEQGSAAILRRADAVADANVLTEEEVRLADDLRVKEAELNDAWHAITRTIAQAVVPTLADLTQGLVDLGRAHITAYGPHGQILYEFGDAESSLNDDRREGIELLRQARGATDGAGEAVQGFSRDEVQAAIDTRAHRTEVDNLSRALDDISGRHVRATVDIVANWPSALNFLMGEHQGYVDPNAQWGAYAGPGPAASGAGVWSAEEANYQSRKRYWESVHPGQTYTGAAQGGPLGPITEVGEEGTEGVINGVVVPHREWERLKRLGILPDQHARYGTGEQGGGGYVKPLAPKGGSKKGATSGGGYITGGGSSATGGEVATVGDVQAAAQETAAAVPAAAAAAVAAQGEAQAAAIAASSAAQTNVMRAMLEEVKKLNRTLPTYIRDAVERTL